MALADSVLSDLPRSATSSGRVESRRTHSVLTLSAGFARRYAQ